MEILRKRFQNRTTSDQEKINKNYLTTKIRAFSKFLSGKSTSVAKIVTRLFSPHSNTLHVNSFYTYIWNHTYYYYAYAEHIHSKSEVFYIHKWDYTDTKSILVQFLCKN